jgi:hypothetical protein
MFGTSVLPSPKNVQAFAADESSHVQEIAGKARAGLCRARRQAYTLKCSGRILG